MKKIITLFLMLIPVLAFSSCSSDSDDFEEVSDATVTVTFDNVAVVNGVIYTTQDYPMEVESIVFNSASGTTKAITEVEYAVDSRVTSRSLYAPFTGRFDTASLSAGTHSFGIFMALLQSNNKDIPDNIQYVFTVVPSVRDLPGGAELGTFTQTVRLSDN